MLKEHSSQKYYKIILLTILIEIQQNFGKQNKKLQMNYNNLENGNLLVVY